MRKLSVVLLALVVLVGCNPLGGNESSDKVIRVGASPYPHGEILKQLKAPLKAQGYDLKIVEFEDYAIPNSEVDSGGLDANYFQHIPYMKKFNEERGTNIVDVLKIHYEPIAIYKGSKEKLEDVAIGDVVLVPDDVTNLPRALKLLEEIGWIRLNDNRDTATVKDIVENVKGIKIQEVKSDGIAPLIKDAPYAILNGNYAIASKITDRALRSESISDAKINEIVNVLAVKGGNESSPKTLALLEAFKDTAVKTFVQNEYRPAVTSVLD